MEKEQKNKRNYQGRHAELDYLVGSKSFIQHTSERRADCTCQGYKAKEANDICIQVERNTSKPKSNRDPKHPGYNESDATNNDGYTNFTKAAEQFPVECNMSL